MWCVAPAGGFSDNLILEDARKLYADAARATGGPTLMATDEHPPSLSHLAAGARNSCGELHRLLRLRDKRSVPPELGRADNASRRPQPVSAVSPRCHRIERLAAYATVLR